MRFRSVVPSLINYLIETGVIPAQAGIQTRNRKHWIPAFHPSQCRERIADMKYVVFSLFI
ncbi:MAG: hypothetical protein AMK71_06595 [Nitrospira bacterium SG8_35_4]|nr:MAG: hypothetical protein AMK71_06595 [Nitrospira bacterium SG8_35_4]